MLMIYGPSSVCNTFYGQEIHENYETTHQNEDFEEDHKGFSENTGDTLPENFEKKSPEGPREPKKRISLKLNTPQQGSPEAIRQQLSTGRSKAVSVEIKRTKSSSSGPKKSTDKSGVSQGEYDRRREILERAGLLNNGALLDNSEVSSFKAPPASPSIDPKKTPEISALSSLDTPKPLDIPKKTQDQSPPLEKVSTGNEKKTFHDPFLKEVNSPKEEKILKKNPQGPRLSLNSSKGPDRKQSPSHKERGERSGASLHPKSLERQQKQEELRILRAQEAAQRLSSMSNFNTDNPWGVKSKPEDPLESSSVLEIQNIQEIPENKSPVTPQEQVMIHEPKEDGMPKSPEMQDSQNSSASFTFERYNLSKSNKEFEKELLRRKEKERQDAEARELVRRAEEQREKLKKEQEALRVKERNAAPWGPRDGASGSRQGPQGSSERSADQREPRREGRRTTTLSRNAPGQRPPLGLGQNAPQGQQRRGERDVQQERAEGRFEGGRGPSQGPSGRYFRGPTPGGVSSPQGQGSPGDSRGPRGPWRDRPSGPGTSPSQGQRPEGSSSFGQNRGFSNNGPQGFRGHRESPQQSSHDHKGTPGFHDEHFLEDKTSGKGGAPHGITDWSKKDTSGRKRQDFRRKQTPEEMEKERAENNRQKERQGGGSFYDRSLMTYEEKEQERKNILGLKKLKKNQRKNQKDQKVLLTGTIMLHGTIGQKDLAHLLNRKEDVVRKTAKKLSISLEDKNGLFDEDMAELIAMDLGFQVKRQGDPRFDFLWWSLNEDPKNLTVRPPVVTVMGHVDHGKTSLLDALRHTDVAKGEAGGITQHIGAYQVTLPSGRQITFIDTPGHQAFTAMRARGAKITDIVILVVAADEGINAQTIEAINHVKNAQLPLIVAINKMDKPGARPDYVRERLLEHEIVTERLGGNVQDVEISALKKTNLDILEESIVIQGDILELKVDHHCRARGVVLETYVRKGHGITASILIQEGTLKKGDVFVVGNAVGKVRLMMDDKGQQVKEANPSQPVEVVGFSEKPESGDLLTVAPNESQARDFLTKQKEWLLQKEEHKEAQSLTVQDLIATLKPINVKECSLILKADTQGSLEGLLHEIAKIHHEEISIKIIDKNVGPVNEGDALLAKNTDAYIVAFNTPVLPEAKKIVEKDALKLLQHKIIYRVTEELKDILSSLLSPIYTEEWLGRAEVIQVFHVKKGSNVAGCSVKDGLLRRGEHIRVTRKGKIMYEGILKSLRYQKDDVKERSMGQECGVIFDNFDDIMEGDELECFMKKLLKRTID